METLKYIKNKYGLDYDGEMPIKLPFDRFRGLTVLFRELGFKVGAEIGVRRGMYSKFLCYKIPKLKLFLIDPYVSYDRYLEQDNFDNNYKKAKTRLVKFNVEFVKKSSMEALGDFNDNSLDFVFIDGNHTFEFVVNDIAEWSKKVKPGGIISGHDYLRSIETNKMWGKIETYEERLKLCQVKEAVDGWTKANEIKPWFVIDVDNTPSWFWVK